MKKFAILYLCAAAVLFPLDVAWLGLVARDFYRTRLGALLLDEPRLGVALMFYAVYVAGIVIFAMLPAVEAGSWQTALRLGALFGFFAYATYDITNLATLKGFPLGLAMVDLAWGTALTAVSAALGFVIANALAALS
jgi:uncharacterized membrane protein